MQGASIQMVSSNMMKLQNENKVISGLGQISCIGIVFILLLFPVISHAKCVDYHVVMTGKIVSSAGVPLQGAEIKIKPNMKYYRYRESVTKDDGTFKTEFEFAPYSGSAMNWLLGDRCNRKLKWIKLNVSNHGKVRTFKKSIDHKLPYRHLKYTAFNKKNKRDEIYYKWIADYDAGTFVFK